MPPSRSGIADYSAALARELASISQLQVFADSPAVFDPDAFDAILYQLGNNADHIFVYEMALRHPGFAVFHEANLHHLVAEMTIRRGDWDAYVEACAFDGGPDAEAFALRARTLATGPDYEGVPMLRRVLERSRGAIAHSRFVLHRLRDAGFQGPAALIPHGAWVGGELRASRETRDSIRHQLGLDDSTPLIGAFGHLKPYKRLAQTLRALQRLVKIEPGVKMILAGEPHPDFPVASLIRTLGLEHLVRLIGFTPEEAFSDYIAACDIVVNLRFPTVGETSGSLLRAFSAAKPSLVSDVGSFAELPDAVCLKVPVDETEEDTIFEFLNLLVSRPDVAGFIGREAHAWVQQNCAWPVVAAQYLAFLQNPANQVVSDGLAAWTTDPAALEYLGQHLSRLERTLKITPPGDASQSVLEMGAYMQITPALRHKLGYGHVRGCYFGPAGRIDRKIVHSLDGLAFECFIDLFDAEKDPFPYLDEQFHTVLCCELIEHLAADPMHLLTEINRILKPAGALVLTTPNIASLRAIASILQGHHPGFFTAYLRPNPEGPTDARHSREYSPMEIRRLLEHAGFAVTLLETGPFRDESRPDLTWVEDLLRSRHLETGLRGEDIFAVARKSGPVRDRFPAWLYA